MSDITAIHARAAQPNAVKSLLPPLLAKRVQGREKRKLGDLFGLTNFGVNIVKIEPGGFSSLRHCHDKQDEFIYILEGSPTLHTNEGPTLLAPGMCAGFKAGNGQAHNLENRTDSDVWYLEIGDRTPNDHATYPDEDLQADFNNDGWIFRHKDGTPWEYN